MGLNVRRVVSRSLGVVGLGALAISLSGCGNFFVKPTTTTGGGSTNTGDYAYVTNNSGSTTLLNAYSLSSGTLTAVTGGPFTLPAVPSALAINQANTFLFVATPQSASVNAAIYVYSLASTGVPTIGNNGNAVFSSGVVGSNLPISMDVTPDGSQLFVLDASGIMQQYSISSSGILTQVTSVTVSTTSGQASQVKVSPNGNFVLCAMSGLGTVVYNLSNDTLGSNYTITPPTGTADYAVAIDTSNYMYVARTGVLAVYGLGTTGVVSQISPSLTTNSSPRSVILDHSQNYVYEGDSVANQIYGYSITRGSSSITVSKLTGSPFAAPNGMSAMGADNSGKYLLAVGYSSTNGIQLNSLSSGSLTPTGNYAASGTVQTVIATLVTTH